jgi:uncharacterized protein (TIGR02996 family)
MSEEAAFLAALKANPADDTTRLVYADWLDEHGEGAKAEYLRLVDHAKAEYLRLIVALARATMPEEHPEAGRVLNLAEQIKENWRMDAGVRFAVTLFDYDSERLGEVIEAIRKCCWIDNWSDAKHASENLPFCLRTRVTFEIAHDLAERLRQVGAVVCVLPMDARSLPYSVTYEVVVSRLSPEDDENQRESHEALAQFLVSAFGVDPTKAASQAAAEEIVFERGLTSEEAWKRVHCLAPHAPEYVVFSKWIVWVHARQVVTKSDPH